MDSNLRKYLVKKLIKKKISKKNNLTISLYFYIIKHVDHSSTLKIKKKERI